MNSNQEWWERFWKTSFLFSLKNKEEALLYWVQWMEDNKHTAEVLPSLLSHWERHYPPSPDIHRLKKLMLLQ